MSPSEICFWLCAAFVAYAYVAYPVLLALVGKLRARPARRGDQHPRSVSVVLAAHNEEALIGRRIKELTDLVAASGLSGETIVVSDGSTDATAAVARTYTKGPVHVIELSQNLGKAAALNQGCAAARNEVIVFADARQSWAPETLKRLLENFADPTVGAASGDLVVETAPGVMAGVGWYWRYEKWIRKQESRVHSTVGVTGAVSAVRRELFRPIPRGVLLDDVYWPLRVAMQGYRVVHDGTARAYDRLPDRVQDEFRRKVRTLSGNFQLLFRLPAALVPWKNPIWFQFLSHKVSRLVVPWALLALLGLSVLLDGVVYRVALWSQVAFYLVALAGVWKGSALRFRLATAAASFLVLNTAAWLAFWVWATGRSSKSWSKVFYKVSPVVEMAAVRARSAHD
jgi:cellulose synthase/poly-beta-1,6-N-acetylglucosamine synthase-like glycosyltransferase